MAALPEAEAALPGYAELHCLSNFSFLRGASHPAELVGRAHALGYRALALTDECSVAGVVRAHVQARPLQLPLIIGSEFTLCCGLKLVLLATSRQGYGQLCRLITRGRRAAPKGGYRLTREDLQDCVPPDGQCLLLWLPQGAAEQEAGRWLAARYAGALWLGVSLLRGGRDAQRLRQMQALGAALAIPLAACGDVHMHERERRTLQDALTAIRHGVTLQQAGQRLFSNGERHLRPLAELARLYPQELLAQTAAIASRCRFSLDELQYQYPAELVPEGHDATSWLRELTEQGARRRWPGGVPARERALIEKELALIRELRYEPFFLTVEEITSWAKGRKILCQGRGSAANSIVCYCLGVTAVGPERLQMLFERFVSKERNEPPDIDVDFEHERREEVIQHIYEKYGRDRAALAATVISYGPRSAVRDLARALALDMATQRQLHLAMRGWYGGRIDRAKLAAGGVDVARPEVARLLDLAEQLVDFPRHLSQHVGGFVISAGPLAELVPVENASMPERTVIQWNKDDLEDLGLLKVDVLALGMLTAIRRCFDFIQGMGGPRLQLDGIADGDPDVYAMIQRADTIGVFQIESRAQMSMLPRLRPRRYYDLVVQVAIVRPGPIQGDMVHPFLRRRDGREPVTYPSREVQNVLARTLGVPIFQEQVMQLAIVAAGFTPGEADELRRAMAAWKRRGGIEKYERKLMDGLLGNGYDPGFAQRVVAQIRGFGDYGFPEAHAASFALLAWVSAWLKHHYPEAFTAALLNSQPMGFYAPAQLLRDARDHGVVVHGVDVCKSAVQSTLESRAPAAEGCALRPALRLGLDRVRSLSAAAAERIVMAREMAPFTDVQDLGDRARLARRDLEALAAAGALAALAGHRHLAFWRVAGYLPPLPTAPDARDEALPMLRAPTEAGDIHADYRALGFTLGRHPLALLRERMRPLGFLTAEQLQGCPGGSLVRVGGIVTARQRPGTSSGVTFVTLEDETGQVNVIVWLRTAERCNAALVNARLMEVRGELQRESEVTHVIARTLVDRSAWLGRLDIEVHEFH
ncbi:MAG: error-prone DNA polymerase [Steroidobacteraceae bacterium]